MAQSKVNLIRLGPGQLVSNVATSRIFTSNFRQDVYAALTTYALNNTVEYSGSIWRSLQNANTGNTPALGVWWEEIYKGVQDGDICVVLNGASSDIQQRISSTWVSLQGQPTRVTLVDGQVLPAVALSYVAATYPMAVIEYTVKRGSGYGNQRHGKIVILNDGTSAPSWSHEFEENGIGVNVDFVYQISGTNVEVLYTSSLMGVAVELVYRIKGWN